MFALISLSIDSFIQGIDQYRERLDYLYQISGDFLLRFGIDLSDFNFHKSSQIAPVLPTLKKLTAGVLGDLEQFGFSDYFHLVSACGGERGK